MSADAAGSLRDALSFGNLFGAINLRGNGCSDPASLQLVIARTNGNELIFPLAPYLPVAYALGGTLLAAEILSLISGFSEARRIRRKLKPLNKLALAAETIALHANAPDSLTPEKMEHLEHAIEQASIETPQISTGDKDLHSIEIALNGLLQRMREAQAQQARFVSDASHELRTPIAVIEGYVSMLDRWGKTDPAVLDESIDALKNESAHMKELVEQLLFLARGDSGRNALERSSFDAKTLLEEVVSEFRMIDADHRYILQVDRGSDDPNSTEEHSFTLHADRSMIKQCLRVIAQNAARYSPAGTAITFQLHWDEGDEGGSCIGFDIQDQGIGMTEHDAAHIFERFYRADAARTSSGEGTGLGLAIAKWIVDAHGGRIDVLSREGIGTRFTVWLPA